MGKKFNNFQGPLATVIPLQINATNLQVCEIKHRQLLCQVVEIRHYSVHSVKQLAHRRQKHITQLPNKLHE